MALSVAWIVTPIFIVLTPRDSRLGRGARRGVVSGRDEAGEALLKRSLGRRAFVPAPVSVGAGTPLG
jgi:hypothetical protein